jgi:hypothetical protein
MMKNAIVLLALSLAGIVSAVPRMFEHDGIAPGTDQDLDLDIEHQEIVMPEVDEYRLRVVSLLLPGFIIVQR